MFPRRYGHQGTFMLFVSAHEYWGKTSEVSETSEVCRSQPNLFAPFAVSALKTEQNARGRFRRIALWIKPSAVSTARLNGLPRLHLRPIQLVVSQRPYPVNPVGDLILGRASRLDAFSGYLCRTWLPSDAPGGTTGTPEVRPPRSSRTGGSSPQVTCAHSG